MVIGLLALGALAAAAGTRAAALAFLGAAGLGAASDAVPAVVTWSAVMAAGLVATPGSPRRLALPALGMASVVAAGSARNAAAVFGLWFLGTAVAVVSKRDGPQSDRWAVAVCLADLPVFAAVCWTGLHAGFEGWPGELDAVAVLLLFVATVVRAPLVSGPTDDAIEAGLLPVRTQAVLLPILAISALDPSSDLLAFWAVAGAGGFLVGGLASRVATRDAVQELGLLVAVLAASRYGLGQPGWEWGVLAGGTLIHNLRLRAQSQPAGPLAAVLLRSGGFGLPLLPAIAVALEGSVRWSGWVGTAGMLGIVAGIAARANAGSGTPNAGTEPATGSWRWGWESAIALAVIAAAVVGGLWASVFTFPSTVAGEGIGWPPWWGGIVVIAAGAAATVLVPEVAVRSARPARRPSFLTVPDLRAPITLARPRLVLGATAALAVCALGMWAIGVVRGFL